jgi:hypothetical protein
MTVIFDVHEDENIESCDQLAKKLLEKKRGMITMAYSQTNGRYQKE